MLRGLYTAAAGMIAQQRRHDATTNNIANSNTPGFKEGNAALRSFPDTLIYLVNGEKGAASQQIGRLATGVFAEEGLILFNQGSIQETNNPADFALVSDIPVLDAQGERIRFDQTGKFVGPDGQVVFQPQAFFTLESRTDPNERLYTRDGSFHVNEQNELVASNGYRVLSADGQPIVLDRPLSQMKAAADGTLIDAATGAPLVQLLISRVDNPNQFIPVTSSVFRLDDGTPQPVQVNAADQITVRQGAIERSNVDPAQAMVDLMTALRAYEANQKVVQFYDRSLEKAVNEVGRV